MKCIGLAAGVTILGTSPEAIHLAEGILRARYRHGYDRQQLLARGEVATYRIDAEDVHAHLFRVTLRVPEPAAQQRLSLPVWIPGSYLVREFARHLSALEARQGSREVSLTQLDKATWQVECSGRGALVVTCLVYAFDTSVRAAFLDAQRGFFNGTSLCLRVHGQEDGAHTLEVASTAATVVTLDKATTLNGASYEAAAQWVQRPLNAVLLGRQVVPAEKRRQVAALHISARHARNEFSIHT